MSREHRIQNRYLLALLASIVRLGSVNVSATVLVESWQQAGREVGELFFLHQDVLLDYGFVSITHEKLPQSLAATLKSKQVDMQMSITDSGRDFLDRYG